MLNLTSWSVFQNQVTYYFTLYIHVYSVLAQSTDTAHDKEGLPQLSTSGTYSFLSKAFFYIFYTYQPRVQTQGLIDKDMIDKGLYN